ncbi:hypothetical protein ERJ75_000080400 [Trypanosoma vivax]|uniref:Uncharacterized protein n=1 Tax=Trypanosoma vivax (strain Y486) TaxID=1055687 RepID=F9WPE2_TRYVY|nr:hypothetical protein ERJ75_000080400 [Trypanosoma vivax]CCD19419.1 hypothetical protein, conserved in T.vivax [Trypanosoma vivax Y486]|eukprot:CCD19419.1 hypothetical protein, conserved in T.vivax [Trypanosoma vivax Y486]
MSLRFSLALLAAVLLNGAVLGDDSTSSGAIAGVDGERNAPSRGGDAGRKSEGRARNGDKLVVLDSARTTPSETVRKSVSVVKRTSDQSSHSSRNEAINDHVGVGNELPDHPATGHEAQASVDDKHGMKLPRARRPAVSRHSEGGLTTTSSKESAEVVDRKKEFENMVSGIIGEEAQYPMDNGGDYWGRQNCEYPYTYYEECSSTGSSGGSGAAHLPDDNGHLGDRVPNGESSSEKNASTSVSASSSTARAASSVTAGSDQSSVKGNGDEGNTNDGEAPKNEQEQKKEEEKEDKKEEEQVGNEKAEKQLEQRSNENNDERETNNSSEDVENKTAPFSGSSALLSGSYSSVLLVVVACLCACAC